MTLPSAAQRVQVVLDEAGHGLTVVEMPDSTRTAEEAAAACGCEVGQIAKSLLFKTRKTQRPLLVVASGTNRVNERQVGQLLGEKIGRADADFVRAETGFAIGGVPPVGHKQPIATILDEDLWRFDTIWAAAGTPRCVFQVAPDVLSAITGGQVAGIKN